MFNVCVFFPHGWDLVLKRNRQEIIVVLQVNNEKGLK